jgi:hypothetical protein
MVMDNGTAVQRDGSGRLEIANFGMTNSKSTFDTIDGVTRVSGTASFATGALKGRFSASTSAGGPLAGGATISTVIVNTTTNADVEMLWGLAVGATIGGTGKVNGINAWDATKGTGGFQSNNAVPGTVDLSFSTKGGTVSPGDPLAASSLGTFTIGADTKSTQIFQASPVSNTGGGRLKIELDATTSTVGSGQDVPNHDLLDIIGGLQLNVNTTGGLHAHPVLELKLLGNPIPTGEAIPIVRYDVGGSSSGLTDNDGNSSTAPMFVDSFGNELPEG